MVYVYVLLLGLSHYLFLSHYRNPFWVVFSSFFTMGKPWDICWDIFTAPSLSSCLDELQASVQTTQTFQRCSESLRLGCEARLLERGQLRSSMESENGVQMWLLKLRSDKEWEKCPYHQFMSFPWSSISSTLWTEAAFFFCVLKSLPRWRVFCRKSSRRRGELNVAALPFWCLWLLCRLALCSGFHDFLSSLRLNSIGFIVFLCVGHLIWTFHPQKSTLFLVGHFAKWQWGHGFGTWKRFFSAPRFGHICAKVLPVRDIRKCPCHNRRYVQMALLISNWSLELHKDDGMVCFASFQQLSTVPVSKLEVDREDNNVVAQSRTRDDNARTWKDWTRHANVVGSDTEDSNVLGRCLTRGANVVGSW